MATRVSNGKAVTPSEQKAFAQSLKKSSSSGSSSSTKKVPGRVYAPDPAPAPKQEEKKYPNVVNYDQLSDIAKSNVDAARQQAEASTSKASMGTITTGSTSKTFVLTSQEKAPVPDIDAEHRQNHKPVYKND